MTRTIVALVIVLVLIVGIMSSVSAYFWGSSKVQAKIEKANQEMATLQAEKDQLEKKVEDIDAQRAVLEDQAARLKAERDSLKHQVTALEESRQAYETKIDNMFSPSDLADEMKIAFPEMGGTPLGLMEVPDPETGFEIEYFMVPTMFLSTFIQDHENAKSYQKQREKLLRIQENLETNLNITEQIVNLADAKAEAYKAGYEDAFQKYEELHAEYVATLKQPPQVKVGVPSFTTILGAAAVGVAAGAAITK